MNQNNVETEMKLYVPDHAPILQRMHALGARQVYPRVFERNWRYENQAGTFDAEGIVLRLREDSRVRLTYKDGGAIHDGIVSRQELEVEVSDFNIMALMLERLGYRVALIYEKYRTTYEFYGAEIVIDELPFGNFVEIEGDTATISSVLVTLELQNAQRFTDSYTRLFTIVKENLGLSFDHLTFANFEGITVPVSAFVARQP
jgi:adenylate cyclase class 2